MKILRQKITLTLVVRLKRAALKEINKFFESHQQLEEENNCETKEELAEEKTFMTCLADCKLK